MEAEEEHGHAVHINQCHMTKANPGEANTGVVDAFARVGQPQRTAMPLPLTGAALLMPGRVLIRL